MKYCTMLPLLTLLLLAGYIDAYDVEQPEVIVVDILNQTLIGQCVVPKICLDEEQSCGIENDHHVRVNCSNRDAGPYIPNFQSYILPRRTWDIDFSHNYIQRLDSQSFIIISYMYSTPIPVNLTALDLSYNYINKIAVDTFRGEVSRVLTTLDLSHNSLKELKAGTFDEAPALEKLFLSHNKLLNIDSICQTAFPSLDTLDVQNNLLAGLSSECLASSSNLVSVNLDDNFIGSVDDCTYSDKMTVQLEKNPILCGCSDTFASRSCFQIDPLTNGSTSSTQPRCSSKQCIDVSFTATPTWYDQKEGTFTVTVKALSSGEHVLEVLQYTVLPDESYSIKLVQSVSAVAGELTSSKLSDKSKYSVCLTPASDSQSKHRSCQYMLPPAYTWSSAGHSTATIALLLCAAIIALAN